MDCTNETTIKTLVLGYAASSLLFCFNHRLETLQLKPHSNNLVVLTFTYCTFHTNVNKQNTTDGDGEKSSVLGFHFTSSFISQHFTNSHIPIHLLILIWITAMHHYPPPLFCSKIKLPAQYRNISAACIWYHSVLAAFF